MAKAKPEPKEVKIEAAPQPAAAPQVNLLPCVAARKFVDGNMAELFAGYGYGVEWLKGEKRKLPMWVIERVRQSGGEIELLRG